MILLAFGFMLTMGLGLAVAILVAPQSRLPERVGLAYGLGLGGVTFVLFLGSWAHVPLGSPAVLLVIAVIVVLSLLVIRRALFLRTQSHPGRSVQVAGPRRSFSVWEKILIFIILFFVMSSIVVALYWPVYTWDALCLFDFRGKLFSAEAGLHALSDIYYAHYPLLTSLGHTWFYTLGADNPKFIYPLFYASLLLVFYGCLRRCCSSTLSMVFATALVATPILYRQSTIAYTNLPFTFYYGLGTIYLYQCISSTEKRRYVLLSGMLLGLCCWTRPGSEPLVLANLAVLTVFCLRKRRWLDPILFLLPAFLIQTPWMLYLRYGLSGLNIGRIYGSFASISNFSWSRVVILLKVFGNFIVSPRLFGLTWVLFFLIVAIDIKGLREHGYLFAMIWLGIATCLGIFSLAHVGADKPYETFAHQSGDRFLLSFLPVVLYYSAVSRTMRYAFRFNVVEETEGGRSAPQQVQSS